MKKGLWQRAERPRVWRVILESSAEGVSPHLVTLILVESSVGDTAVPFLPPHTLSVPPEDTELKVSQNLAQESEKCCWAHVPKLGQFPHPPATSLGLRSRGPLHYVPRPRPVPWLLCQQGGYFQPNRVIY